MMNYLERALNQESLGNQLASSFNISYVSNANCDCLSISLCRYSANFMRILELEVMFFCYLFGFSVFYALLFYFLHWFFHFNKLQVLVWASWWPLLSYVFVSLLCFVGHSGTFLELYESCFFGLCFCFLFFFKRLGLCDFSLLKWYN